jgi:hypothetical protein
VSKYENYAVPFQTIGDVECLTDKQIVEWPELVDFIAAFPKYFERDECRQIWRFYRNGK